MGCTYPTQLEEISHAVPQNAKRIRNALGRIPSLALTLYTPITQPQTNLKNKLAIKRGKTCEYVSVRVCMYVGRYVYWHVLFCFFVFKTCNVFFHYPFCLVQISVYMECLQNVLTEANICWFSALGQILIHSTSTQAKFHVMQTISN